MSIWKRILLFLAVFLLVLTAVCFPFRGRIPSWMATLKDSWDDRPYQIAGAGSSSTLCAARVEKDGSLTLRFFDPSVKRSLVKWSVPLPEAAAQGEISLLYPVGDQNAFLGVYEEDAQYLSLYWVQKEGTVERLLREDCVGNNPRIRRNSRILSTVSQQQNSLYFALLTEDKIRTLAYTAGEGLVVKDERERGGSLSAVVLSDTSYRGEAGELELTFAGNGLFYVNGTNLTVQFADLAAQTHNMELAKLKDAIGDHQVTSLSLTQEGGALLLLDGHILLLVDENDTRDLSDQLFTAKGDCAVRLGALLAEAVILSTFVSWMLGGWNRGRLPLAVYWGVVSVAMIILIGAVVFSVRFAPARESAEMMQKLELTDEIVDLALTEHAMGDEKLPEMVYRTLGELNSEKLQDLQVVPVHREGGFWYLSSGVRAELSKGVRMACLKNAYTNGIAYEKSGDRFWYCMKHGENGLMVSYRWGETPVVDRMVESFSLGLISLAAGIVAVLFLIGRDVRRTSQGLERFAGDLDWKKVKVSGGDELEGMASTLNSMAAERRDEERRRERMITSYRRFVPEEVLKLLGKQSVLDVDKNTVAFRQMAVMRIAFSFPDPMYTNGANTRLMFESVNQVIERTASIVRQKGGVVFNFAYDGYDVVMERDPQQVISTAVAVRQEILALNQQRAQDALPTVKLQIAADIGGVILGIVGDQAQLEPSTISDSFSTLSELIRICDRAEANILCTESIISSVEGYGSRYIGRCLVGHRSLRIYEVYDGDLYEVRKGKEAGLRRFSEGVLSLYSGEIVQAKRIFLDLVRDTPRDGCARYYLYLADRLTEEEVDSGLSLNGRMEMDDDST